MRSALTVGSTGTASLGIPEGSSTITRSNIANKIYCYRHGMDG